MVFPVVGGTQSTGYDIDNSLRFNDDDSASLSRTPSSASNRKTWTWSGWIKRGNESLNIMFLSAGSSSGQGVYLTSGNQFQITKSAVGNYGSTALLRDVSAWYHLVVAVDTTQTGMSNIAKFYINGVQQTASGTTIYSTNEDTEINNNTAHYVSRWSKSAQYYHDGYLAEVNFIDGQALDASYFGETNDNGVWIPKQYTGSYGTNGFFHEFKQTGTSQNSSGIGADTSGNDNHYAVSNLAATDVTVDTPTNNFCTLNPLHKSTSDVVLSEGNLKMVSGYASGWQHAAGTMAVKNGKWYWEAKALSVAATDKTSIGVLQFDTTDVDFVNVTNTDRSSKGISGHGAGTGSYTYAQGDIIMCGMDLDNNKVYWGKNGTWFGNLDPAAGSGSTTQTIDNSNFCVPAVGGYGGSSWEMNFGVPQFSISSGNEDDAGYGNFEYDVPSGFYALCTKNLAEYG